MGRHGCGRIRCEFALLFLLVTQREALDTTLSMALGVTAAGGTLVKLTSLLAQLGVKGDPNANG